METFRTRGVMYDDASEKVVFHDGTMHRLRDISSSADRNTHMYDKLDLPDTEIYSLEPPEQEKHTDITTNKANRSHKRCPYTMICALTTMTVLLITSVVVGIIFFVIPCIEEKEGCPKYTHIQNGEVVKTTGSNHGDFLEIKCYDTGKLVGSNFFTCLSSGKWSSIPECVQKKCDNFIPTNSMQIEPKTDDLVVGTELFVTCNEGFELHGNEPSVCQSDESWSAIPTCEPIDCGDPRIMPNAKYTGLFNTTYNSTFSVECYTGHRQSGSKTVTCTHSGVWDKFPICEKVSCGVPDIPTGGSISNITGIIFQATVTIKCNEGYILTGANTIHCQANGLWTSSATCSKPA